MSEDRAAKSEYNGKYYEKNRDKMRAYARDYYAANRESGRRTRAKWQRSAIERGYFVEYRKRFPAYHALRAAKNRAKKRPAANTMAAPMIGLV